MDKKAHGAALKAAMAVRGLNRQAIADATGVEVRTVTNWTSGQTKPSPREYEVLHRILGQYDHGGDPVEAAVRGSELTEWRQDAVLSFYKRNLHEQRADAVS
jgi:transcriptional regulator with XRE-family HTH domain